MANIVVSLGIKWRMLKLEVISQRMHDDDKRIADAPQGGRVLVSLSKLKL